jgi:hypothetical protein
MNEFEPDELTEQQRRAREAVRGLPTPAAEAAFRSRLRAQFASGRFEGIETETRRLPWHLRPMTRWTLAVAATLIAVASILELNQAPAWRVVAGHGDGIATIDDRAVPLGHTHDLDRSIRAGAHLTLPVDADLELEAPGNARMQIVAGSDIVVPGVPGRWFLRRGAGEVKSGEVRITTEPCFHGATFALATPETHVLVTGTTLAVICESTGTCVCVLEGVVRVGANARAMNLVPGGMRAYVYADGRPLERVAMRETEIPALTALRAARDSSR